MFTRKVNDACNKQLNNLFNIFGMATPIQRALQWASELGMNQSALARKMNVSPQDITNWKKRGMPPEHHQAAAQAVNRSVDELLGAATPAQPAQANAVTATVDALSPGRLSPAIGAEVLSKFLARLEGLDRNIAIRAIQYLLEDPSDMQRLMQVQAELERLQSEANQHSVGTNTATQTKATGT